MYVLGNYILQQNVTFQTPEIKLIFLLGLRLFSFETVNQRYLP